MKGSDTHYGSGEEIRAGDRVRCFDPADWSYLGRGFMVQYDQAGLVFNETADEDLELVARA